LQTVASLTSFFSLIAFLGVHIAVIVLRFVEPEAHRPFRTPLVIRGIPLLPIVGILMTIALLLQLSTAILLASAGSVVF
jgi:APA family basic amino acid/polyamine antiporter